jgi:nitroreductase
MKQVCGSMDAESERAGTVAPDRAVPAASTNCAESALGGGSALKEFVLPAPRTTGGIPLIDALHCRHTTRQFAPRPLTPHLLSDLLWAAFGVNRANGDRTAPYWRHVMVMDIYLATAAGVWRYEPQTHRLVHHLSEDIRAQTGSQDFVAVAPVELIYVAHGDRMQDVNAEERRLYASVDAAFIGQNVYLFCASEHLGTVFRGAVDTSALGRILGLPPEQFVTFAQTVGYAQNAGTAEGK